MKDFEVGMLLRAKGSKRLYIYLGVATPQDYVKFGLDKAPRHWKDNDWLEDHVLCEVSHQEFLFQTIEQIKMYFEPT